MKIAISGCNGRLAREIYSIIPNYILFGIDYKKRDSKNFPVFKSFNDCNLIPEIIIEASSESCINNTLNFAKKHKIPLLICTTGYDDYQLLKIENASKIIPIFKSANMSLGINLVLDILNKCVNVLGNNCDIEIIERHHNKKIDAPSGTALMFIDELNKNLSYLPNFIYGRSAKNKARDNNEIAVHSIRGGSIIGSHEISFINDDEIIEIKHTALNRSSFANGVILACKFLKNSPIAGLYSMKDLIK